MNYAKFGPGGNGDWFRADGMKNALQTPGWLESKGIDAFEYEATRGVNASEEALRAFGTKVREHGITVSLHASYFISLSSVEEEKRQNSVRYITQATRAAEWIGAHTIVIHSGSTAKRPRAEAMALSKDTLARALDAVGDTPVKLGIETMGKLNQLGTLEEVIEQCRIAPGRLVPVVDFGHLNCREQGRAFPDADAYAEWKQRAESMYFCKVVVSDIIERNATPKQKEAHIDIADWIIFQIREGKVMSTANHLVEAERILQRMIEKNPVLQKLIDDLDLVLVGASPIGNDDEKPP